MIELPAPHLTDGTILLRPWDGGASSHDAEVLALAWADPGVQQWTAVPEIDQDQSPVDRARHWIEGDQHRRSADLSLDLAIVRADDPSQVWGEVGLANIDFARSGAEIGFWIGPAHRGAGLAARAVRLLSHWTMTGPLQLGRVYARTDPGNVASARALADAGYLVRGRLSSGLDLWSINRD